MCAAFDRPQVADRPAPQGGAGLVRGQGREAVAEAVAGRGSVHGSVFYSPSRQVEDSTARGRGQGRNQAAVACESDPIKVGDRPDIEIDGETFESPFHAFMHECMQRKNLSGLTQRQVQEELADCSNAWEEEVAARGPEDVDARELAGDFLEGRIGRATGER